MIIVSQDKRTIINFDNLKTIELDKETNFTSINIFRATNEVETGVCGLFIGHYATKERAKEVLEEITKCYINTEQYKCLSSMPNCNPEDLVSTLNKLAENAFIYEMPKE